MKQLTKSQLEDRSVEFLSWLKEHHCGEENAITFKQMNNRFGNHRTLRHIVHHLRTEGYPICSGNSGYYYAKNKEEVQGVMKYLNSFIANYQEAFDGLNKALKSKF